MNTPIRTFRDLSAHLVKLGRRHRIAVVNPSDSHTEEAIQRLSDEGLGTFILVGRVSPRLASLSGVVTYLETTDEAAAATAVRLVREGQADILMKGLINTDVLLRAVLDKQSGLLPEGQVLTHLAVMESPAYHKLLFMTDVAVIPHPTLAQRIQMMHYLRRATAAFGIAAPKISLLHFNEKVSEKYPETTDYTALKGLAAQGTFGDVIIDGPLDVATSVNGECARLKGIDSPVVGDADALMFPCLEAGNAFYKTVGVFAQAKLAGILMGTLCPIILASRGDSSEAKYNSLAFAALVSHSAKS